MTTRRPHLLRQILPVVVADVVVAAVVVPEDVVPLVVAVDETVWGARSSNVMVTVAQDTLTK